MKRVKDFHFKKFTIRQEKATHKVGTDGVLLGAWVNISDAKNILDVGTGSGVIAIMLAQRTRDEVRINAVEIQQEDAAQATINAAASPWHERITIFYTSVRVFQTDRQFDLIVTNPPYFINSWLPPSAHRVTVRHATQLTFNDLIQSIKRLLSSVGRFAIILPYQEGLQFTTLAADNGLYCLRRCMFKARREKPIERILMEFCYKKTVEPIEEELVLYEKDEEWSEDYKKLTKEFYLKL